MGYDQLETIGGYTTQVRSRRHRRRASGEGRLTSPQDVMNASVKAYWYNRNQTYSASKPDRWLDNFVAGGANDPTENAPDLEGLFTIPVCIASPNMWVQKYETQQQLAYPCSCGGSAAGGNNYGNETDFFLAASALNESKSYNDFCGGGPEHKRGPPEGSAYVFTHKGR